MSRFKLDNRTLTLLSAQVSLTETFNHKVVSTPQRSVMPFKLKVEHAHPDTTFTVEMGTERHSLTLANGPKAHLKLADFIEEIANGPTQRAVSSSPEQPKHFGRQFAAFETTQIDQVFQLVRTGGALSLDLGFDLPIHVAIHRTATRPGITTIMSIGVKRPRTKCFTVAGTDAEIYAKVTESIKHLAAMATPAAHAA